MNSIARWRRVQRADDLAGRRGPARRRGSRCRRACSRGWRARGCRAASAGSARCGQRLDLGLLVDAEHDRALGRVEIEPDDIADLVDELRVLGELPGRPGGAAAARTPSRSACTADCVSPTSRAIERVDQCVASLGVVSSVLTITSSTWSSVIVRGCPGRGSSSQPVEAVLGKAVAPLARPSVAMSPRAARRSRCCSAPRPQPARSASAAPAPARSTAAAPTPPTARARRRVNSIATATRIGITPPLPDSARINASRH